MGLARVRLAVSDAGADIPAAKIDVSEAYIAAAGEMQQQFFATDALGGDVEGACRETAEALGNAWHGGQFREIDAVEIGGHVVGRAREELGSHAGAYIAAGPLG